MNLSKRERVIRTLELDDRLDKVPIHYLGFETTSSSYQTFIKSNEYKVNYTFIKNDFSRVRYCWAGDITELRFWDVDCHAMDPWGPKKHKEKVKKAPPEYPDCIVSVNDGRIWKLVDQVETGLGYLWYVDGIYRSPEILYSYWDEHGKPSESVNDKLNYSPQIWKGYVNSLKDYLYPMVQLPVAMHESLIEGMTLGRVVYYMRKNPQFIHKVMQEYLKLNIEILKRVNEAGSDVIFYSDDLGYKGRSILSNEHFTKFILPYYEKLYQECKKRGMFIIQHSCGYVDKLLPYMVSVGLNCIQVLEPAAGVDLAYLKKSLGDRVCFMGGIDSSRILNFGTPEDIDEEVKRCINAAAHGGGYFVGPSHNILNAPMDNIIALKNSIEKYRKYPLNLN